MKRPILIGVSAGLAILIAVLVFMYAQHQSRAKFDNIDRAVKAIQTATQMGTTPAHLRPLVEALALEDAVLRERVTSGREKARLAQYHEVLSTYQDSLQFWEEGLRLGRANRDNVEYFSMGTAGSDKLARAEKEFFPTSNPTFKLSVKYQLPEDPNNHATLIDEGVRKIWAEADKKAALLRQ